MAPSTRHGACHRRASRAPVLLMPAALAVSLLTAACRPDLDTIRPPADAFTDTAAATGTPSDRSAIAGSTLATSTVTPAKVDAVTAELERLLWAPHPPAFVPESVWLPLRRRYAPLWVNVPEGAAAAWATLCTLVDVGLRPDEYLARASTSPHAPMAAAGDSTSATPSQLAEVDLRLSAALVSAVRDLLQGRVDPAQVAPEWRVGIPAAVPTAGAPTVAPELGSSVTAVFAADDPQEALHAAAPSVEGYRALADALRRYHRIAEESPWASIAEGPTLRQGRRDALVAAPAARLAATGDLAAHTMPADSLFTRALARAVSRFQARHGLPADGVVGPRTLAALNRPVEALIRQLEINLERYRWIPRQPSGRFLVVDGGSRRLYSNAGAARLLALRMSSPSTPPAFSDAVAGLVISPRRAQAEEPDPPATLLTLVSRSAVIRLERADRAARATDAGITGNALGNARIDPAAPLRATIDDAGPLLALLLPTEVGWDSARVAELLRPDSTVRIALGERVPLYVLLPTAWTDRDGRVHFRDDATGADARLAAAFGPVPPVAGDGPPPARACPARDLAAHVGDLTTAPELARASRASAGAPARPPSPAPAGTRSLRSSR